MIKIFIKSSFIVTLFFSTILNADEFVLANDEILKAPLVEKISSIGNEMLAKSGVFVGIVAIDSLNGKKLKDITLSYASNIKKPYVILSLVKKDHLVDIYESDKELLKEFDKEQILSVIPGRGTIIPILANTKKDSTPSYDAALLNGYADIVEQIAQYRKIELKNTIGNSNKNTINVFRAIFYCGILVVVFAFLYYKFRKKYVK
ncbi:MAG: hypothetical protein SPI03_01360 [Campylobacter sputorum]|uniref:hypothetical protein n=1 Tax=Campylobacter sputorum TaxID=206 RepID=UPI002A919CD7|nr:hypothetical protein [Campylobacter sputorum]MDY6119978.1 hypothetical protein [Campylobacter sputorum]